jgi:thioredoxin reductase (NADPH)
LASHAAHVHHLIRGADLVRSMSKYLIDRIGSLTNVTLYTESEIVAIEGCEEGVNAVRWRHRQSGAVQTKSIRRIFLFVGADPNTGWLENCGVKLNDKGFVCTGLDLSPEDHEQWAPSENRRHPLQGRRCRSGRPGACLACIALHCIA